MSKIINLEFDGDGILQDYDIAEIRQGDIGVIVNATFEGIDNATCIARINFTRPDEKNISNVLMTPSATDAEKYSKTLDSAWYFAKSGEATLTVFLVDGSGTQIANGQVVIAVQKTDYSDDPTITPDEYNELLAEIAKRLKIEDGILKKETMPTGVDLSTYADNQVFFIKNGGANYNTHTVLLQLNATKTGFNLLFDFTDIKAHKIESISTDVSRNEENNIVVIHLLDENGIAIATSIATIRPATSAVAGLMSATDKATINAIPSTYETKAHASATYETIASHDADINDLQSQIDAIISKSDVVDVVEDYQALLDYDTSDLGDRDIIKVLVDETRQNQRSYYRWLKADEEWEYVGSEGEYYTKAESDLIFLTKVEATALLAKKQNKVHYGIDEPEDPEEGDLWTIPTADLGETIIGDGLDLTTDQQTGAKTLQVKLYLHTIKFSPYDDIQIKGYYEFSFISTRPQPYTLDEEFTINLPLCNVAYYGTFETNRTILARKFENTPNDLVRFATEDRDDYNESGDAQYFAHDIKTFNYSQYNMKMLDVVKTI